MTKKMSALEKFYARRGEEPAKVVSTRAGARLVSQNRPPPGAKRFAHSNSPKARASQIPLTELNEWGYPARPWQFVGFFNSTWEMRGTQADVGFSFFIDGGVDN